MTALNIAFVVCQDYGNGYYNAYAHLAQEQQVDYVIHLGDYVYEATTGSFQGDPVRTIPPFPSGSTTIPLDVNGSAKRSSNSSGPLTPGDSVSQTFQVRPGVGVTIRRGSDGAVAEMLIMPLNATSLIESRHMTFILVCTFDDR